MNSRLLVIPWSGGQAKTYFRRWKDIARRNNVELLSADLPESLGNKGEISSTEAAVEMLYKALKSNKFLDRPLAIWGHSLGGIIGYELTRKLQSISKTPYLLMVSSVRAPATLSSLNADKTVMKRSDMTDEDLMRSIVSHGGLPAGVDRDFLRLSLPRIRRDFKIFDTYNYNDLFAWRLNCPIVTFGGSDDSAGEEDIMREWSSYSCAEDEGETKHHAFKDGHHFYFQMEQYSNVVPSIVLDEINARLPASRRERVLSHVDGFV